MQSPLPVSLTVNGLPFDGSAPPRKLLSDFLREDVGLNGVRVSCEHGICGACTVLVDGKTVRSCLMLAVQADGSTVTTVPPIRSSRRSGTTTACSAASVPPEC